MLVSGLTELAVGAMTGWPMALATEDPERARAAGIRSTARLRQWHLDLIALGALNILVSMAVPDLPRRVAYPLTLGTWTNANLFGVLVFAPGAKESPAYKGGAVVSFVATSWGFTGAAATAALRMRRRSRGPRGLRRR